MTQSHRGARGVFVTGTNTGVGKTLVTAVLAAGLKRLGHDVGVMKPVETGVSASRPGHSDAGRLQTIIESEETLGAICPYRFEAPVAPVAAARAEGRNIDLGVVRQVYRLLASRYDYLIVEGVGGVRVPLTRQADVMDLIAALKVPVIVVGCSGLGGINHALLTIEALRRRKLPLVALVLNRTQPVRSSIMRLQERTTIEELRREGGVPVLGPLPYEPGLAKSFRRSATRLTRTAAMVSLTRLVKAAGR